MAPARCLYLDLRLIAIANAALELEMKNAVLREIINIPKNYLCHVTTLYANNYVQRCESLKL